MTRTLSYYTSSPRMISFHLDQGVTCLYQTNMASTPYMLGLYVEGSRATFSEAQLSHRPLKDKYLRWTYHPNIASREIGPLPVEDAD